MSFTLDLKKFADKTNAKMDLIVRKIVIEVGTSLVLKSPVGDPEYWITKPPPGYVGGRFRGNWQFGINSPNKHTDATIDKTGSVSMGRVSEGLPEDAPGNVYYITNSLPYAYRLEHGWSHRQAPQGMVAITIQEFQPKVAEIAKALNL